MANYDNKGQPGWAPPPAQAPPYSPPGQPGWAQPPPGPNYGQPAHYGTGGAVVIQQPAPQTVVVLGGCPTCRVGHLEDEFTCCGILCCILFFPLGLICLFTMRDKRCTNCGASF
jgi:hypothetical protein